MTLVLKSNSQEVHPLQALLSLLVSQQGREAQRLPVFLGDRHHHEHPLVRLYQQNQQGQQRQGFPVTKRERISVDKSRNVLTNHLRLTHLFISLLGICY